MSDPQNGDRRKINWALVIAFIGWGGFGLVAWGSTTKAVDGHEKRIDKIEASYVSDRDMAQINAALSARLARIEGQLDRIEQVFRRPQP